MFIIEGDVYNLGATNSQMLLLTRGMAGTGLVAATYTAGSVDTTSAVTASCQMNVANTDTYQPTAFTVTQLAP